MRRALLLAVPVVLVGTFTAALTVGDAVSNPGVAEAVATQYTVTRTYGPYNGQAAFDTPGSVPDFSDAPSVACNNSHDALLAGAATINRKTTHGTSSKDVLNLDRLGAIFDPEDNPELRWATWIRENGNKGWNTVTITITCLVRK